VLPEGKNMSDAEFDFDRYKRLLAEATDERKRLDLIELLIEERARDRLVAQGLKQQVATLGLRSEPFRWDRNVDLDTDLPALALASQEVIMKKPSKSAAELEAMIKVQMETISEWPTGMTVSVQPDGDSWAARTIPENPVDDAALRDAITEIASRLKAEFDLKN
jgi:hypothetical protein